MNKIKRSQNIYTENDIAYELKENTCQCGNREARNIVLMFFKKEATT